MVDPNDWDLNGLRDVARRERLLNPPPAEDLLTILCGEAMTSATRGDIATRLQDGEDMKGFFRALATIPVSADTFDLLFNGRSGYRAQYYLSVEAGGLFNRLAMAALFGPLRIASNEMDAHRSWAGPWSKIWVTGDSEPFKKAPAGEFQPRRWAARLSVWLSAPRPDAPCVDVKGTWLSASDKGFALDPDKADRDEVLHKTGGA